MSFRARHVWTGILSALLWPALTGRLVPVQM
jgi:hypothetical protein